jgi:hypothetical protein
MEFSSETDEPIPGNPQALEVFLRESWTEGDLRYSLRGATRRSETNPALGASSISVTVERRPLRLKLSFGCRAADFPANRPLLERCARSFRWERQ